MVAIENNRLILRDMFGQRFFGELRFELQTDSTLNMRYIISPDISEIHENGTLQKQVMRAVDFNALNPLDQELASFGFDYQPGRINKLLRLSLSRT